MGIFQDLSKRVFRQTPLPQPGHSQIPSSPKSGIPLGQRGSGGLGSWNGQRARRYRSRP